MSENPLFAIVGILVCNLAYLLFFLFQELLIMLLHFFQLRGSEVFQLCHHELQLLTKFMFVHDLAGVCVSFVA